MGFGRRDGIPSYGRAAGVGRVCNPSPRPARRSLWRRWEPNGQTGFGSDPNFIPLSPLFVQALCRISAANPDKEGRQGRATKVEVCGAMEVLAALQAAPLLVPIPLLLLLLPLLPPTLPAHHPSPIRVHSRLPRSVLRSAAGSIRGFSSPKPNDSLSPGRFLPSCGTRVPSSGSFVPFDGTFSPLDGTFLPAPGGDNGCVRCARSSIGSWS